ncbi:MCE family protein [Myxococcota bacterium]|nr:MCE family protein [Myxococcota bacterium]
MSERSLKIKVGLLVVFALTCLMAFVAILGAFSVQPRRAYFIELSDSGALLVGAPVKIAGVRAGRVEEVEFLVARDARKSAPKRGESHKPINVRVRIEVDEDKAPAIRKDAEFFVTSQGVLGEKYLEISPGTAEAEAWPGGSHIRGNDPPRLDLLMARTDHILEQLEGALGQPGGAVDFGQLVGNLTRLSARLDAALAKHEGALDGMVVDLSALLKDTRSWMGALRAAAPPAQIGATLREAEGAARRLNRLARALEATIKEADRGLRGLNGLLEETRGPLKAALSALLKAAEDVRSLLKAAREITQRVKDGRGTVGALLRDGEVYDDLKAFLRELRRDPWKLMWRE